MDRFACECESLLPTADLIRWDDLVKPHGIFLASAYLYRTAANENFEFADWDIQQNEK